MVVVGGGIVGTAAAREILLRNSGLRMAILEKEPKLAVHQSGHNSGVIHAGIYYKPRSLKAKLCVEGMHLSYKYFDARNIPYKKCGKLIVATNEMESGRLMDLYERGIQNEVPDLQLIEADQIQEIEPYCAGVKAILSPHTGIVDWALVTNYYGRDFTQAGGEIFLNFHVNQFQESDDPEYPIRISGARGDQQVLTKYVLTCGGLQSDKLAQMTGCSRAPRIVPFRGEYLLLNAEKAHMVRGNIYPVPDPRYPFLGVHFTPRMDGSVWLGPNAVLAFKREGYAWSDLNVPDLFDTLSYGGFRKMAAKNWQFGFSEMAKSALIPLQARELQKYIPAIGEFDMTRGPAGVRAQALDEYGNLVDDFVFHMGDGDGAVARRVLHCRNAPSPGATSSLAIAKLIAQKVKVEFKFEWLDNSFID